MKQVVAPLTDFLLRKASDRLAPVSGTFELSPECNFTCRMCYVRKTHSEVLAHGRPMMTLEQWLEVAERARDAGMLFLLLTGGEPLLWPDFWELYEKLIKMGFLVSINTNGSMIDDAAIARFRELPPSRFNITLYGASDETYEALCNAKHMYSRVEYAILGLKKAGLNVKLNCSLTPHNIHDLEKIVQFSKKHELLLSATTYMFPPVRRDPDSIGENDRFSAEESGRYFLKQLCLQRNEEGYYRYIREICEGCAEPLGLDESCIDPIDGKIRCRAGKASFWITWDGYIGPCGMMPEPKTDVLKYGFDDAWRQTIEKSAALRLSGICEKCSDHDLCHACAAIAYAETGSVSGIPTYLCRTAQEMKKIAEQQLSEVSG